MMGSESSEMSVIQKYRNKTFDDTASVSIVTIPPRNEAPVYQSVAQTQLWNEPSNTQLIQVQHTLAQRDETIADLQQLNDQQSNKINELKERINENQETEVFLSNRLKKLEIELGLATSMIEKQRSTINELKNVLGTKKVVSVGINTQNLQNQLEVIRVLKSELVQKCVQTGELEQCLKTVTEQSEKYKSELESVVDNINAEKRSILYKFEDFKKFTNGLIENYEIKKKHLLSVLEQQEERNS